MKKKKDNIGKKAVRNVYICDQGHYGSTTCELCGKPVGWLEDICPNCGATLILTTNYDFDFGGSDF